MLPALVLALGALPRALSAGPITFNTALPVHAGEWIVRQQTIWLRATDDPSPLERDLSVLVAPTILVYGLNPRVALFAIEPFLSKQLRSVRRRGGSPAPRRGSATSRRSPA